MPEPNGTVKPQESEEVSSLLDGGDVEAGKERAAQTPEEIAAAKQTQEAEEKRLLEAKDEDLSAEDKEKKSGIVKTKEEKRLLEAKDEDLSAEDKVKKTALIKAQDDAKKAAQEKGAPETYAEFKLPDGIEINQLMLDEFKTVAKEANLSQEAAQKLVDLQVKYTQQISDGLLKNFNETVTAWKKETVQELGADYKKELVHAGRAIEQFGTPELRVLLKQTGVANHKEMVRFFIKVGKAIGEDTFVHGVDRSGKKTDADLFYPGMNETK
ncbi:MAG: hypothetical protein C4540_04630 [Candidatus Omnitrophota bacterium]|jgi:hypothetical protein|nr:MAG: hypothetical protein C4540_04630 [Candidatus Omnitrophota bacterium]